MTRDYYAVIKKHELWVLIKRIGALWGEDEEFTREYAKTVWQAHNAEIEACLECFRDLVKQADLIRK